MDPPLGIIAVVLVSALVLKPLMGDAWEQAGGFVLLAGACAVLLVSTR